MFNTKQPYVVTNHHLSYQNPPVFFTKHYISKHLNPSNYKPCLYNLFVYLYTKNTKDCPVFFHKNSTFQKSSCVLTKHYISYQKHLNLSNYKPCLYNLFVYLYTKNTKDRPVFFHKNTTFQKSSCVLTKHYISYQKHLNPSNYKPCLYNLFVYLYTKNIKVPPVFFHKTLHFKILLCFFHKTLHFISETLKSE